MVTALLDEAKGVGTNSTPEGAVGPGGGGGGGGGGADGGAPSTSPLSAPKLPMIHVYCFEKVTVCVTPTQVPTQVPTLVTLP